MVQMATPQAEVDIDARLVAALLSEQHPDLAHQPLRPLAAGWDNVMFRVGNRLVARLPRRLAAVPLLLNELRWLPEVATGLPLPVPVPVRSGAPGCDYPWPWSISPWLPGQTADSTPPT